MRQYWQSSSQQKADIRNMLRRQIIGNNEADDLFSGSSNSCPKICDFHQRENGRNKVVGAVMLKDFMGNKLTGKKRRCWPSEQDASHLSSTSLETVTNRGAGDNSRRSWRRS